MKETNKSLWNSLDNKGRRSDRVKPFNCEEERWLDMVGDILALSANDYRAVCRKLKILERERKLGYYKEEISWTKKVEKAERDYEIACRQYEGERNRFKEEAKRIEKLREEFMEELIESHYSEKSIVILVGKRYPYPKKPDKPKKAKVERPKSMTTPFYYTQKAALESARDEIRGFFLGDSYKIMCDYPGNEVLNRLDEELLHYDPKPRNLRSIRKSMEREGMIYEE